MPPLNAPHIVLISVMISSLTATSSLVTAYLITPTYSPALHAAYQPTSALASKVIFQSPSMENIYKEFVVSSKPLTLRKYAHGPKVKKTKKDSKIYYIPIPPMPYRYIPGVGYDYQPMKISPIMKEAAVSQFLGIGAIGAPTIDAHVASSSMSYASVKPHFPQLPKPDSSIHRSEQQSEDSAILSASLAPISMGGSTKLEVDRKAVTESPIVRMQRGNYYFNGRPFRLQVTHAHPKHKLTPQNLKTKLYFNKRFIY